MSRKVCIGNLTGSLLKVFLFSVLLSVLGPPLRAQEIRILILNGHNGKPIDNECLNVWLGPSYRRNLIAPTNRKGVVVLHLEGGEVTADTVSSRACNGMADLGPKRLSKGTSGIAFSGDLYVPCQEYGKRVPEEPLTLSQVNQLMPSYPIKRILKSGVTASNTCGKIRAKAKPGELIIFERPMTFWERLRE